MTEGITFTPNEVIALRNAFKHMTDVDILTETIPESYCGDDAYEYLYDLLGSKESIDLFEDKVYRLVGGDY